MGRIRKTIQETLVLEAVEALHNHPTIEQVYEEVRRRYPNIGKATVYRNLLQLAEAGKISSVNLPGSPIRYDHRMLPHHHFQCRQCGDILDVDVDLESILKGQIKAPRGALIETQDIVFGGLCTHCNKSV